MFITKFSWITICLSLITSLITGFVYAQSRIPEASLNMMSEKLLVNEKEEDVKENPKIISNNDDLADDHLNESGVLHCPIGNKFCLISHRESVVLSEEEFNDVKFKLRSKEITFLSIYNIFIWSSVVFLIGISTTLIILSILMEPTILVSLIVVVSYIVIMIVYLSYRNVAFNKFCNKMEGYDSVLRITSDDLRILKWFTKKKTYRLCWCLCWMNHDDKESWKSLFSSFLKHNIGH
jgi:hypothetical protein